MDRKFGEINSELRRQQEIEDIERRILSLETEIKNIQGDKIRFAKEDEDKLRKLESELKEAQLELQKIRGY